MMDQPVTVLLADASLARQALFGELFPTACRVINISSLQELERCLEQPEFQPDLLLLADNLPGIRLPVFMDRWRHFIDRHAVDLVVIGADDTTAEAAILVAGASLYLPLPLNRALVEARLGVLLQKRTLIQRLEGMSVTDGLTGIANRRRFDEVFASEWRWAQRQGSGLAVMMIDVDVFKLYNDSYGHLAGDQALLQVAQALQGSVKRAHDLVARYGGEEFAAVLPAIELSGVGVIAERMMAAVHQLQIAHPGSPVSEWLTVSIGSAWCQPGIRDDAMTLLDAADQALYRAKRSGRNRHVDAGEVSL
ncbi:GGDEF domain-containing protein [Oceanobacter mangrovi]|uniref:GGDEF domain-containing protein n=1 Tax=Oceanobacter mangrovi TaxID=2862510 RepID=UPI001C8E3A51|nr:diguanylate cyclase [Oceanobacter mangrovi]